MKSGAVPTCVAVNDTKTRKEADAVSRCVHVMF